MKSWAMKPQVLTNETSVTQQEHAEVPYLKEEKDENVQKDFFMV